MKIIPAIDIIGGKCVRLTEGDFSRQTTYETSPLETAKCFEAAGFDRLHMVDLDGARQGSLVNLSILIEVAANTRLKIDFGGGIKTDDEIKAVFNAGAHLVNVGSIALRDSEKLKSWIGSFGGDRILLAADVREGMVATAGWQENSDVNVITFLQTWHELGLTQAFITDILRDGALKGPNVDLYKQVIGQLPGLKLIASGGVGSLDDLHALKSAGCHGAIVGKAIYENRLSLSDLIEFQNAG